MPGHHYGRASESRDGIKIRAQHDRNFRNEHIAHHASSNPGQHSEQGRHNRVEAESQRFLRTGNCEEGEPCTIEHQHRVAHPVNGGKPVERNEACHQRNA